MTPPIGGSFSPANNSMCDQSQVTPQMDGLPQDLQPNPMSPMQPTSQQAQAPPSASQPVPQQSSQSQLTEMPNMVDSIGVSLQQNIIDPYRRTGKCKIKFFKTIM